MTDFPTDETTLTLLIAACKINPDNEQTNLQTFLNMGTREKSRELIDEQGGIPVYELKYEEGYEPFSEQLVIISIATELLQTRADLLKLVEAVLNRVDTGPVKDRRLTNFASELSEKYGEQG